MTATQTLRTREPASGSLDPIAYTADAAVYCTYCAAERWGLDDDGYVPESAVDNEGNEIGAVFGYGDLDEWATHACDSCLEPITDIAGYELDDRAILGEHAGAIVCPNCRVNEFLGHGWADTLYSGDRGNMGLSCALCGSQLASAYC